MRYAGNAGLVVLVLLLAGCDGGGGTVEPPVGGNAVVVSMSDNAFAPASVTVARGATVRWVNNGATPHNTTSSGTGWASSNLNPGQSFERTMATAGTFAYTCTLHPGMNGTVVVQ